MTGYTLRSAAALGWLTITTVACGDTSNSTATGTSADTSVTADPTTGNDDATTTTTATTADTSATQEPTGDTTADPGTTGPIFDVGVLDDSGDTGEPIDVCKVGDDGSGVGPCRKIAPADSFTPELQWSWAGDAEFNDSIVTPLVANMTDDNGDGEIDLCDVPDVLVTVNAGSCGDAHLYLLDGATGTLHYEIETPVARASTPAIGDIDGDGLPEIVAQTGSTNGCSGSSITAWDHDGSFKWNNNSLGLTGEHAIALADLDNDGDVEIMINNRVLDHNGVLVHALADNDVGQYWTWRRRPTSTATVISRSSSAAARGTTTARRCSTTAMSRRVTRRSETSAATAIPRSS